MAIKGVLFDKDGTLLDYAATWMPANQEAAEAAALGDRALAERLLVMAGYDAERDLVHGGTVLAGGTPEDFARLWLPHLAGREFAELAAEIDGIFVEAGRQRAVAVDGMPELVIRLKGRGFRLGIATSDSRAGLETSLARFGVLELMDFVAGYDCGHGQKPDPGQVHGFCTATGLVPEEVAVVGDNHHDMEMGRRAGAGLLVGVLTGTGAHDHLAPHAHHVLASVVELEALLDAL